jgi:DNA adenine methylase
LEAAHERLAGVVIECLPWAAFLDRYDRKGVLFYLDPPYWGSEDSYGKDVFPKEQFALLADRLASIKGRFIASLNDAPDVRRRFRRYRMEAVRTTYTVSGGKVGSGNAGELIITGPRGR